MFSALLEVARLDSGAVAAHPVHLSLRPLLKRLVTEFGEEARRNGLRLELEAVEHTVLTDPVLLTALQLLHGVVFGIYWIGIVELFRRAAPREIRASAQAVVITASYGIGPLLTSVVASALVDDLGTSALFGVASASAGVAAVLTLLARPRLRAAFASEPAAP